MTSKQRPNYEAGEVQGLIEEYTALKTAADTTRRGLRYLVLMADLNRALEQLPDKYWEVVLLHGLLGISQRETAQLLQIKPMTVNKRFRLAIEDVVYLLNGGE